MTVDYIDRLSSWGLTQTARTVKNMERADRIRCNDEVNRWKGLPKLDPQEIDFTMQMQDVFKYMH